MSQKTLNLCLERYNFVKFGETTKSSHTVLCINNAYSVNSDKYRLTPAAIASKHGEGYVFTLNYDFDRPLFTIVQKSYALDGTSGNIVFEGIDPISKGGSKYLRKVTVSPVKLSDGSYLLEVTKDEYLRIGTTGAALGDEELESLNEKIIAMGGIEKSVETVGGKQVLKLDASGSAGAKEIVYFDVDPSDPPSGIYEAIGEALSNNKLPAIRNDGKLYQYTSTDTDRYDFVGMFGHSDVGYEALTVWIGDAVNIDKLDASLGYTAVPASGTDESPAWAKVCELDLNSLLGYTSYGLALLFTSVSSNDGENVESGLFVADIGSNWHSNSNGCNASWMVYTPNSDEYSKILGIKLIGKYGVPSNPVLAPYPIYKVEVWVKYYGSNEILVNALQNARYNYSYGMSQGLYKFPEGHIATPQSTEPSYADTEEYVYKNFFYPAESPSVAYTHGQSLTSDQKAQGRDNIGAASASDVTALQSQVSSLSDVSAYSVKGEATVAQLNAGPSGIQAGWAYQLTDSGTLTDGSLAVVAGDTVAWDGTKWFPLVKSDYYATKFYAQNVAHSIAPEYVPANGAKAGNYYTHNGKCYYCKENTVGDWISSKFVEKSIDTVIDHYCKDLTYSLVEDGWLWKFKKTDIRAGEKIRIEITKTSGTSTGMVIYKNSTSSSDIIKSWYAYGTVFEYTAEEDISVIICYAQGVPSGQTVELSGMLVSLSKLSKVEENVSYLNEIVAGLESDMDSSAKAASVDFDVVGANLGATEKTIEITEPMKAYKTLCVKPTPNPWPVNTVGGTNPTLFKVAWVDADNVQHTVVQKENTLDGLPSVVEVPFPENAKKIYFFVRANANENVNFKIYPKVVAAQDLNYVESFVKDRKFSLALVSGNNTFRFGNTDIKSGEKISIVISKESGTSTGGVLYKNSTNAANIIKSSYTYGTVFEYTAEEEITSIIFYAFGVPSEGSLGLDGDLTVFSKLTKVSDDVDRLNAVVFSNVAEEDIVASAQNKLRRSATLPQFALIGDPHNDRAMISAVEKFKTVGSSINFIICLGDICSDYPNVANAYKIYNDMLDAAAQPVLPVIGNHDVGSWYYVGHYAPISIVVENVMGPAIDKEFIPATSTGYYYKDFSSLNLRVVVLNLYDNEPVFDADSDWEQVTYDSSKPQIALNTAYSAGDVVNIDPWTDYSYRAKVNVTTPESIPTGLVHTIPCFSKRPDGANIHQTQAQWLADTLLSTPANYGVILVGHTSYSNKMSQVESNFMAKMQTNQDMQSSFSVGIGGTADIVADILDKFINGQDATLEYTRSAETISISCAFSGKNAGVKYIGYMAGHLHYDAVTRHPDYSEQYSVHACATFQYNHKWTDIEPVILNNEMHLSLTLNAADRSDGGSSLIKIGLKKTDDGYLRDCARIVQN